MIGLLHEIAEAVPSAAERKDKAPRALVLAIEEPELHQHPLQARSLADALEQLAGTESGRPIQVAYSTHSPHFTHPALFGDLRLCRRNSSGGTTCVAADADAIRTAIKDAGFTRDVANSVEAALATNLREAIFAQGVLLCEGPSDAALLEGLAEIQGGLDRDGVAIASCGNKQKVCVAIAILKQLEIPSLLSSMQIPRLGIPGRPRRISAFLNFATKTPRTGLTGMFASDPRTSMTTLRPT